MRFREWVRLHESGHIIFNKPMDLMVLLDGRPTMFNGVTMIDPRFEFQSVPNPPGSAAHSQKFLGDVDFALPLVGPKGNVVQWVSSNRTTEFSGGGAKTARPVGYAVGGFDWGKAQIIGADGRDMVPRMQGGAFAAAQAHAG